jgi:hypothetical protein
MFVMGPRRVASRSANFHVDAEVGRRLIEVKAGVTAVRNLRASIIHLAYATAARPGYEGILLLPDVVVTRERLEREWQLAASVFRPGVLERLSLCMGDKAPFAGIPHDPDPETERVLEQVLARERGTAGVARTRGDARFVVLKVLLNHWLTNGEAVTTDWLMRTSGYSYPTIAGVLDRLGSLIERQSDRRLRLRWFSREEFTRLLSRSDSARATVRFGDRSGQPRSPELHLRRLEKLAPEGVAIGGVLGARHYLPDLDIAGLPRLDLSQHCRARHLDIRFVQALDPALARVEDPLEPATLVIHAVRHADPLFERRTGGLFWADPVECLLDLHEARLDMQASQFLDALQRQRPQLP